MISNNNPSILALFFINLDFPLIISIFHIFKQVQINGELEDA